MFFGWDILTSVLLQDHPDYNGAKIAVISHPEIAEILHERSIRGAMMRMMTMQALQQSRDDVVLDFSAVLARASEEEKSVFSQESLQAWSTLEMTTVGCYSLG